MGETESAYLRALDLVQSGPTIRCCSTYAGGAKDGTQRGAGPSPYSRGDKWQFWCKVDWSQLVTAQGSHPEDELMQGWVDQMTGTFGDDCEGGQTSGASRHSSRAR
eukprot:1680017-Pyramimonas_sp.AAC.1